MNTILIKGWVSGDWVPTKNSLWLDCDCATAGHQQSEAPGKLQECRNNVIQSVLQSCGALQQLRELQYPKCGIFCCSVEQRSSLLISDLRRPRNVTKVSEETDLSALVLVIFLYN
ncbi:unnamed protein product [Prunus armeniaca]|uniref:Uncharacterized protein n=1 Tax=Prunus armeniaca TaxID=36596 RepID=A0A6J5WAZ7_PRUAR|nr:unnamed protein product [Prunus armeniaca]CAB4298749.1 unnamed protein product [Prunus armeniaca]